MTSLVSLQEFEDLQELANTCRGRSQDSRFVHRFHARAAENLELRLRWVSEDLERRAEQHLMSGRYKEAEYIYDRRIAGLRKDSLKNSSKTLLASLVSMYGQLGHLSAAELAQSSFVSVLAGERYESTKPDYAPSNDLSRESTSLAKLFIDFYERAGRLSPDPSFQAYAKMSLFYRLVAWDIAALNALLIDQGLVSIELDDWDGFNRSLLHVAAEVNAVALARLPLDHGAQLERKKEEGESPLFIVAQHNYPDMVKLLLKRGAKVQVEDRMQSTPLHAAFVEAPNPDIVRMLVNTNIDLNAKDWQGQTTLDMAIKWDCVAVSEFLLTAGSFNHADGAGERSIRTPLIDTPIKSQEFTARILHKARDVQRVSCCFQFTIVPIRMHLIRISRMEGVTIRVHCQATLDKNLPFMG